MTPHLMSFVFTNSIEIILFQMPKAKSQRNHVVLRKLEQKYEQQHARERRPRTLRVQSKKQPINPEQAKIDLMFEKAFHVLKLTMPQKTSYEIKVYRHEITRVRDEIIAYKEKLLAEPPTEIAGVMITNVKKMETQLKALLIGVDYERVHFRRLHEEYAQICDKKRKVKRFSKYAADHC